MAAVETRDEQLHRVAFDGFTRGRNSIRRTNCLAKAQLSLRRCQQQNIAEPLLVSYLTSTFFLIFPAKMAVTPSHPSLATPTTPSTATTTTAGIKRESPDSDAAPPMKKQKRPYRHHHRLQKPMDTANVASISTVDQQLNTSICHVLNEAGFDDAELVAIDSLRANTEECTSHIY